MNLELLLRTFGLDEKEAKVYLASLSIGAASVYEIAIKSGLKRPTTYLVVDELLKKELLSLYKLRNKTYYTPLSPKKLIKRWETKVRKLDESLPEFEKLAKDSVSRPFVQFYEGLDNITSLYEEINLDPHYSKEILFFGSFGLILDYIPDRMEYWLELCRNKRVHVRGILDYTKENKNYVKTILSYNLPYFEARFLPKKISISSDIVPRGTILSHPESSTDIYRTKNNVPRGTFGPVNCAIVGDRLYIISFIRDIFGIKIQNQLIAHIFRMMYDMAWGMAEKITYL